MKLSIVTLKILQYFSRLSEFIYYNVENKGFISVNNLSKDLYCYYNLNEKEKQIEEFVLYHYDEILEMMKVLDEEKIEFEFKKEKLIIKDDKTNFSYLYANKELIQSDKKLLSLPKVNLKEDINFFMKGKELFKLNKILKSMKMDDFSLIFKKEKLFIDSSNQTKTKNFKQELNKENLNINNEGDFKIKLFVSALRDLNFSMDYKINIYKKLKLLVLNGFINIKREKKIIQREIPFMCLMLGKK